MGSVGWVGCPEGRSSKYEAGHVEPPGNIDPSSKEMRLAAPEVCANLVSWVYPGVISKSKDAGGRNPGKSCEKGKKRKQ